MANCYAAKCITIFKDQDGYYEKASNKDLDSKTANKGTNNYTKFARDLDKEFDKGNHIFNGHKQAAPWCATSFTWAVWQACEKDIAKLRAVLCIPKDSLSASCRYAYGYYKKAKRVGKEPKLGAQVFFGDSESALKHTGMVIAIDDKKKKFTTQEGNAGNKCTHKTYSFTDKNVFGFGYPKYDAEPTAEPVPQPEAEVKEEPKPEVKAAPKTKTYTVNVKAGHILRLRSEPNTKTDKNIITKMPKGSKFEVSKTSGNWAYGKYRSYTGWASLDYLK